MVLRTYDRNVDIILVNAPKTFDHRKISANLSLHHPSGIMALASALRNEKIEVAIIDCIAEYDVTIKDIIENIKTSKVPILGISATSSQIMGAYQLAKAVKKKFNDEVTICIGGAHVSADHGFQEKFSNVFDLALAGEGEVTFVQLTKKILGGEKLKGQYYGEMIKNIENLPMPARDLINWNCYSHIPFKSQFALLNTIRGCPFQCIFCSNPVHGKRIRYQPIEYIIEEIKYCKSEFGVKYINIQDDTLTLKPERIIQLCERLLSEKIKIKWGGATRANLVNEKLIKLMAHAGCIDMNYGIESGNTELREEILKKGVTTREILNAFRFSRKYGIETGALCMLGFPGETRQMMLETVELVRKIKADIFGFHITILMPGSDLYNIAIDEGKIDNDVWNLYAQGTVTSQPKYIPDGFSLEDIEKIQMSGYKSYYFNINYLLRRFLKDISSFNRFKNDLTIGMNLLFNKRTGTGRE